ncbi:MAG: tRNA (adenosine(37)-N6)-dimethylallyltransferase MiaA, partial [Burkholderiales bacterium]
MSSAPATPVLFLLGPTASGKTALATRLVDQFAARGRVEIVSVDSALVYREMNIGTAKPDTQMLADYPHHMIDLIDPD